MMYKPDSEQQGAQFLVVRHRINDLDSGVIVELSNSSDDARRSAMCRAQKENTPHSVWARVSTLFPTVHVQEITS